MNLIISRRYYHKRRSLWLSLTAIWAVIAVVLFSIICPSASSWKDFILILFPVFGAMVNFTSAFGLYLTVHKGGVKVKDLNHKLSLFIPWQNIVLIKLTLEARVILMGSFFNVPC